MKRLRAVHVGVGLWGRSWAELVARAPGLRARRRRGRRRGRPRLGGGGARRARVPRSRPRPRRDGGRRRRARLAALDAPAARGARRSQAGCHVIVEKPLALDARRMPRAIAAAADAAGRHAMVAQNYRFRRQSRALRDLVAKEARSGGCSAIRISCRRDLRDAWISRRDWRGRMPHPYLLDMAIHHVDMLRMITGREVVEVDARELGRTRLPLRARPDRGGAAHARRRHAGLLRGHVGRATPRDVVERRLGARRRARPRDLGQAASTTPCGGPSGSAATASAPSASRCRRCGRSTGSASSPSSAARSPPVSSRRPRPPTTYAASRVIFAIARSTEERRPVRVEEILAREDRPLPRALFRPPLEEALDAAVAAGCETVEIMSGSGARIATPASFSPTRTRAGASRRSSASVARRSRRSRATRNPLHPSREIASTADPRLPGHGAARGRARGRDGDHVLGLPGRVRALAPAELGHLLVADDFPGDARLAVGEARAPVLGRGGRVRPVPRRPRRDRAAPGLRRLQHRLDAAPARERGRRDRGQLRSVAPLLAGDGPARLRSRARGRDLPRPCQGHGLPGRAARAQRRARADSRRPPRGAKLDLPLRRRGPSRPLLARARETLRSAGYDGALSIEHEDPLLSREDGLAVAVETLRAALDQVAA